MPEMVVMAQEDNRLEFLQLPGMTETEVDLPQEGLQPEVPSEAAVDAYMKSWADQLDAITTPQELERLGNLSRTKEGGEDNTGHTHKY